MKFWKLYQNVDGLWADLVRAKYLHGRDLFSNEVPTRGSQLWNALQKIKWYFKLGASIGWVTGETPTIGLTSGRDPGHYMLDSPVYFLIALCPQRRY
jgi:hypothetical protein